MSKLDLDVIAWAVRELRDLDELCRAQMGGYAPFDSADMDKIHLLEKMVEQGPDKKQVTH